MKLLWNKIEIWLSEHAKEIKGYLRDGASSENIRSLEYELGYALPDEIKENLMIHNGTDNTFVELWQLLGTKEILFEHTIQKEVLDTLKKGASEEQLEEGIWWWTPAWIPIASDGSGNLLCIDTLSGPDGYVGRVIEFDHDMYSQLLASDFRSFLTNFAEHLETGDYYVNNEKVLESEIPLFTQPIVTEPIYYYNVQR